MQKNESALPPPVPPRRRRCKVEPKRPAPPNPRATKSERKHRPAPPLPPPAAPQRSKLGRKTPSPFPNCSPAITKSPESLDYGDEITKVPQRRIEKNEEPSKVANVKKSGSPFSESPEPNKYPPLYFTYQDFQTVMEGSLNQWKSVQNLAEAEEKLEEIITSESENEVTEVSSEKLEMNSELIIKINQAIVESKATTNQREKSSEGVSEKIGKNAEAVFSPFVETVTFNNEREEIYFRVTTTDRPFEKFLGEWNKSYDNDVEEFSENQCSDLYIFEDYIDRSNRLNARPQLLFSEDFFSMPEDNNSVSTEKSTTKVRFLIESPSTSTPDLDLDDDGTSYGEYVERQFENYKSSVQLVEVTDEELSKLNENANSVEEIESDLNAENKFESEAVEDENLSESSNGLTRNQSNESYSDWEEDAEVFNRSPTIVENSQNIEPSSDETTLENNQITGISTDETVEVLESDENTVENQLLENKIITSETYQEYLTVNEDEQACNKTVIFIDSSLYNLSNEEGNVERIEDTKTKEIPKIIESFECYDDDTIDDEQEPTSLTNNEENTQEPAVETISETVSTVVISPVEEKPVPVSVSRNSFLETMLSDNNSSQNSCGMSSVNCEVIAAHPKQESSSTPAKQQNTKAAAAAVDAEAEVAPRKNSKIKLTEPGARPKSQLRINANPSNNKSAGEVKSDVLNELLSNFSAIKLRSVNTNTRESIRTEGSSDQMKPVEAKTDDTSEIKSEDVVESSRADSNSPPTEKKSGGGGGDIAPSVHKDASAIVKEAPYAQRNHNDNKAMTPVVVSKDQFREAVSITPGSVRSFVKYYEIHSEISSISKLKDNAFKKQKSELAREKDKAKKAKKSSKTDESNNKSSKARGIEESRKVSVQADASGSKPIIQQQSCMKGKAPSPKPERKKSVQFDKECTVINPPKKETEKDDEEGTFSSFIGGIRTRLKGKAPAKPDVKKNEQPKGLNPHQRRTESDAIICIQKSPEAKAVACTSKPGNSFLPNNETLQNNQTIVFYCTV